MGPWFSKTEGPRYVDVDGLLFPQSFSPDNVRYAMRMRPGDGDVVIAGFPNSGAKTVAIVLHLLASTRMLPSLAGGSTPPWTWSVPSVSEVTSLEVDVPLIEWKGKDVEQAPKPRMLRTHLPYSKLNINPQARYIYTLRNPKDCCAHAYEDATTFAVDYGFTHGRFDDFLKMFLRGEVHGNDYFRHVASWWEHRGEPHVMCLVFEDLRMESRTLVDRVLSFINWPDAIENSRNAALMQEVLEHITCGPAHTRIMEVRMSGFAPTTATDRQTARISAAGFWKNYFTCGQSKRMDLAFQERTKDSEVARLWDEYNVFPS
ncbi:sulfotransferase ssu-1-like [Haemaphysalis longicornis]